MLTGVYGKYEEAGVYGNVKRLAFTVKCEDWLAFTVKCGKL